MTGLREQIEMERISNIVYTGCKITGSTVSEGSRRQRIFMRVENSIVISLWRTSSTESSTFIISCNCSWFPFVITAYTERPQEGPTTQRNTCHFALTFLLNVLDVTSSGTLLLEIMKFIRAPDVSFLHWMSSSWKRKETQGNQATNILRVDVTSVRSSWLQHFFLKTLSGSLILHAHVFPFYLELDLG